jgi:hypothetical protein
MPLAHTLIHMNASPSAHPGPERLAEDLPAKRFLSTSRSSFIKEMPLAADLLWNES